MAAPRRTFTSAGGTRLPPVVAAISPFTRGWRTPGHQDLGAAFRLPMRRAGARFFPDTTKRSINLAKLPPEHTAAAQSLKLSETAASTAFRTLTGLRPAAAQSGA
jgi:hypothetical protein